MRWVLNALWISSGWYALFRWDMVMSVLDYVYR